MALQIGIVGLPNAGKSTLFNALTQAGVPVAPYPFTTVDPHVGVAAVPDARLEKIVALIRPEKSVPATIRFLDIAGLVRGAHKGEGLGNRFLSHIREADALAIVLRCFENQDVVHVDAHLDPISDLDTLDLELSLADLETVERRIERTQTAAKSRPRDFAEELDTLGRLRGHLEKGLPARTFETDEKEDALLGELFLLTRKPRLLIANVGEDDLPGGGELAGRVLARARQEGSRGMVVSAELEASLPELSPEEAAEYREALELDEPGLNRLIRESYDLLGLITFFTVVGGEVTRAWELRRGLTVWHAAGKVHTDMQRGFIRADVVSYDDLVECGSTARARELGRLRSEGRDYVVQDGDVIQIHFRAG